MSLIRGLTTPEVILFDWDNTLVDSFDSIFATMNDTLVTFGQLPWTREEARERIQHSGKDALPLLFGDRWQEAASHFYNFYDKNHLNHLTSFPGVSGLLELAQQKGIKCGIVSNKRREIIDREIEHLGIANFFGTIVGSGDAAKDKPAPDPALLALDQLSHSPGTHVWFVGDAPVDWECANTSGCTAVAVGDFPIKGISIHLSVANCPELQKILEEI